MTAQPGKTSEIRELFIYFIFLLEDVTPQPPSAAPARSPPFRPLLLPSTARPAARARDRGTPSLRSPLPLPQKSQICLFQSKDPQKLSFCAHMARLQPRSQSSNSPAIAPLGISRLTFPYRTLPVLNPEFYFYSSSPADETKYEN
jgi:hypothetical protein